jgi:C-terminal processing protease CtpA/Prc
MKIASIILGFTTLTAFTVSAQKAKTTQDSIREFYGTVFPLMKNSYVHRDKVDWKSLQKTVNANLAGYTDFKSSLKELTTIFTVANADHCAVYFGNKKITGNFKGVTTADFSEQWLKKFQSKPIFEVKVLDNKYGYILMPGISTNGSSEEINKLAQPMYDAISKIKSLQNPEAWIIDLRQNTGGNCVPMILALYDFLGDNKVWGILNENKKFKCSVHLEKGKYIENKYTTSYIHPEGVLLDKIKVALITNQATGSSGEVTALAFKGRGNTVFIGDNTNGKTTTNTVVSLPFDATLAITIGYDCDRNGNYYDVIKPDVSVVRQDNFDDLLMDNNITEAIKFFKN